MNRSNRDLLNEIQKLPTVSFLNVPEYGGFEDLKKTMTFFYDTSFKTRIMYLHILENFSMFKKYDPRARRRK